MDHQHHFATDPVTIVSAVSEVPPQQRSLHHYHGNDSVMYMAEENVDSVARPPPGGLIRQHSSEVSTRGSESWTDHQHQRTTSYLTSNRRSFGGDLSPLHDNPHHSHHHHREQHVHHHGNENDLYVVDADPLHVQHLSVATMPRPGSNPPLQQWTTRSATAAPPTASQVAAELTSSQQQLQQHQHRMSCTEV